MHAIILNEDNTIISGVSSKEGEEVHFKNAISLIQHPKINDWLTLLEKEIRFTLATLLNNSVQASHQFRQNQLDTQTYLEWTRTYQVQIVVLSAQISWSECVEVALKAIEANPALITSEDTNPLQTVLTNVENTLKMLADSVLHDQPSIQR